MFMQASSPCSGAGPILIEAIKGSSLQARLNALSIDNAFEVMLIGLVETAEPELHAEEIVKAYADGSHLHDDWYKATPGLLAFIQHVGQEPLRVLLAETHPGGLSETPVDVNTMAKILGVSVPTVRRMEKAGEIPCMRWGPGRILRFVPRDVLASLARRQR